MITDLSTLKGKIRVLLVAPVPPPYSGGIANWTHIIRRRLADHPEVELDFVDTSVRWRKETNYILPVRLMGGSLQALRDVRRARRKLKPKRFDVVHICTSGGPAAVKDWLILRAAKAYGVASTIHYRMGRLPKIIERGGREWQLIRRGMELASSTIVLDKDSLAAVRGALPGASVTLIPNGVEIDVLDELGRNITLPPVADRVMRTVFIGHVIPAKGLRELIGACGRLADKGIFLEVIGVGEPNFQKELEDLAKQSGRKDWYRFHGSVDHDRAMGMLHAADVFVLPSYTEGAPNTVLEAMGCGKTILSTPVGAVPEMLDLGGPEECGICVPPREIEPLAEALSRLIEQPVLRRELGAKARRRAEQLFDMEVICRRLINHWDSLRRGNPPRSCSSCQR